MTLVCQLAGSPVLASELIPLVCRWSVPQAHWRLLIKTTKTNISLSFSNQIKKKSNYPPELCQTPEQTAEMLSSMMNLTQVPTRFTAEKTTRWSEDRKGRSRTARKPHHTVGKKIH